MLSLFEAEIFALAAKVSPLSTNSFQMLLLLLLFFLDLLFINKNIVLNFRIQAAYPHLTTNPPEKSQHESLCWTSLNERQFFY